MTKQRSTLLALAVAALAAALAPAATAAPEEKAGRACFMSSDWDGWNVSSDGDALYLKVRLNDIYRVELTPGSHARKYPDYFLVNRLRGSTWICSPLDLDMTLSDRIGYHQPLIAKSLRKLTPEEIAAIPRKELP